MIAFKDRYAFALVADVVETLIQFAFPFIIGAIIEFM